MSIGSKIDFQQLRIEIQHLKRWHPLYKLLKEELTQKGFWKLRPRGNPSKAYKAGWGKHAH